MAAGGNVLWQIIWFLILIFIAFPVAGFCAGWYILILPFTVCIDGLTVSNNETHLSNYHVKCFLKAKHTELRLKACKTENNLKLLSELSILS